MSQQDIESDVYRERESEREKLLTQKRVEQYCSLSSVLKGRVLIVQTFELHYSETRR